MSAFFVTGAGTEIGKTYVSCALLRAWRARNVACSALKPIMSGFDPNDLASSDAGQLLTALGVAPTEDRVARIAPWRFRAPLAPPLAARLEGQEINGGEVLEFCSAQARVSGGALLIEGAGGVMAPISADHTNIDLIAGLGLPVIFVAGSYLGAVSHALTALACLRQCRAPVAAIVVSESEASVGLDDTIAMLKDHGATSQIIAAARGDTAWAADLVVAIASSSQEH